ncbi:uncharacterized protein LOC144226452 isoform X6 [Crocuta crocuta]
MLFGLCCQRERLYKPLYIVQVFILAGVAYYYFQESVRKPAPDHEIAGESAQPIGETLRPVWGLMDKCYPVTAQRRRVRSGKKQASEAVPPRATGGPNGAAEGETDVSSQHEGAGRAPEAGAAGPVAAGKEMAEEEEVAGRRGGEEDKNVRKEIAIYRAGKMAGPGPVQDCPSPTSATLQRPQIAPLRPPGLGGEGREEVQGA